MRLSKARNRAPHAPGIKLDMRCSCGSTLKGVISCPVSDAFQIRDIFMSFHREGECMVTDKSGDVGGVR